MATPRNKTDRLAALTGGGKPSVQKDVHHLRPIGVPAPSPSVSPVGSNTASAATPSEPTERSEHQRPVTEVGPLPVRRWRGATALAYEVNGYKEFKVVAPRSIEDATNSFPHPTDEDDIIVIPLGPESVEYAPHYAVPGDVERIVFDPARIAEETRIMNALAEKDEQITAKNNAALAADLLALNAETDAQNAALESKKRDKHAENKPRRDMGDFADDEDGQCYLQRRRQRIAGGERVAGVNDDDY